MPLVATADLTSAVASLRYRVAFACSISLPGVGTLDVTNLLSALQADEQNTSSYQTDLTDQSGETDMGGSLVLRGKDALGRKIIQTLNPSDPASVLYRQDYLESKVVFGLALYPPNSSTPGWVYRTAYVKEVEVDVLDGTCTVHFNNVPARWNNLPDGLRAVMTAPPLNAGLTNEFVIDRIARALSDGAISSWPAQRPNCILAVSLRGSLAPEVGTLLGTLNQPSPTFAAGPYGTGLTSTSAGAGGYSNPQYGMAAPYIDATPASTAPAWIEGLVFGLTATSPLNGISLSSSTTTSPNAVYFSITTTGLSVSVNQGTAVNWSTAISTGVHYFAAQVTMPQIGGGFAAVTMWLDGASHSATATLLSPVDGGNVDTASFNLGAGVYAGIQVTTEATPTPNSAWVPKAHLDPSLNTLSVVPAIAKGTDGWQELQTIAESEGGWIGLRNEELYFFNRDTILQQAPSRAFTVGQHVETQTATVGQSTPYDGVTIDFNGWAFSNPKMVFTPAAPWKLPAGRQVTYERDMPNGQVAAFVDGSLSYLPAGHSTNDGNSWVRYSYDKYGNGEAPAGRIDATVETVTSSRLRFTFHNHNPKDAWTAAPNTQTDIAAGTASVWVGGRLATADNPTTVRLPATGAVNPYQMPSNAYRQDEDSTRDYGADVRKDVTAPKPSFGSSTVMFDPRVTPPDKVTLDVLVDGGVQPTDCILFAVGFSVDFEAKTIDMTIEPRAVAPPGAWLLGTPGRSELGGTVAGVHTTGTAYAY